MFMNTFTLETDTMNTTPPEIVHKSVEVKQESEKPPHFDSSTSFRKQCMPQVFLQLYFTLYRQVH